MAVEIYVDNSVIDKIMITIMSIIRKRKKKKFRNKNKPVIEKMARYTMIYTTTL